jgi:RND family efflux transporter MFP subunit
MTNIKRNLLPIIVIGSALAITITLVASRPGPKRTPSVFQSPLVETLTVTSTNARIVVTAHGTVIPSREITLLPEVSGRITWVSKKFVPGGKFKKGEAIVKIDARNYETAVAQRQAQRQQALLSLELEKGKKRVAEREWALLKKDIQSGSNDGRSLALREPQLKNANAVVYAAEQALARAKLDLNRTSLRSPFNAVVLTRNADLGQIVGAGRSVAQLAGTDAFWVEANIPMGNVAFIETPKTQSAKGSTATVVQRSENQVSKRSGFVARVLSNLDPVGRMARAVIEISDPLKTKPGELPIFLGSFTEVSIHGKQLSDVYEFPESVVQTDNRLFILNSKSELEIRKVGVVWKSKKTVLINKGLRAGEKIITTRIPTPVPGMKLRTKNTGLHRKPVLGERS